MIRGVQDFLGSRTITVIAKSFRNEIYSRLYVRRDAERGKEFAKALAQTGAKNVCFSVSFNAPWVVDLLTRGWSRYVSGAQLVIVDNSSKPEARREIASICERAGVAYFSLPPYRENNLPRSHGMALTWLYHNIARELRPEIFGFVDHDFIPIGHFDMAAHMAGHEAIGVRWNQTANYIFKPKGPASGWFLWAGFAVWRYALIAPLKPNFLPQMECGLDTAGRLWHSLYSRLPAERFEILREERPTVELAGVAATLQIFDGSFLHVGGAGTLAKQGRAALIEPLRQYIAGTYLA